MLVRITVFGIALACCCTEPMNAGSETTSGVEIAVEETTIRVKTAAGATVMIFNTHYVAGSSLMVSDTVTADESGGVAFVDLPEGSYNLFVYSDSVGGAALLGIPVGIQEDALFADTQSFAPLRTIIGTVTQQGSSGPPSLVFISGSPYYTQTNTEGKFSFAEVPVGTYSITVHQSTEVDSGDESFVVDLSSTEEAVVEVTLELQ